MASSLPEEQGRAHAVNHWRRDVRRWIEPGVKAVAAAAVILVLPAYVLHDVDFSRAVLIAEGVAVSAW
jgi:hypothetical protein